MASPSVSYGYRPASMGQDLLKEHSNGMSEDGNETEPAYLAVGMAVGVALGISTGMALDSPAVGLALGMVTGIAMGTALGTADRN